MHTKDTTSNNHPKTKIQNKRESKSTHGRTWTILTNAASWTILNFGWELGRRVGERKSREFMMHSMDTLHNSFAFNVASHVVVVVGRATSVAQRKPFRLVWSAFLPGALSLTSRSAHCLYYYFSLSSYVYFHRFFVVFSSSHSYLLFCCCCCCFGFILASFLFVYSAHSFACIKWSNARKKATSFVAKAKC